MLKHRVGLFHTGIKVGNNMFPANVMTVEEMDEIIDRYFLISKLSFILQLVADR